MEYCLAIKESEELTHATIWMNFENIILSEKEPVTKTFGVLGGFSSVCASVATVSTVNQN